MSVFRSFGISIEEETVDLATVDKRVSPHHVFLGMQFRTAAASVDPKPLPRQVDYRQLSELLALAPVPAPGLVPWIMQAVSGKLSIRTCTASC